MAPKACVPARTSAAWRYDTRGCGSGSRSSAIIPEIALMMWANACIPLSGPVWPKPEMEQ